MKKQRKRNRLRLAAKAGLVVGEPLAPVPEQLAKGVFCQEIAVDSDTGREIKRYRNYGGWPPDLLFSQYQTIDRAMYDACTKFSRDFYLSGLMPRVSLSAMPASAGAAEMSDRTAIALKEWGDAMRAIQGTSGQRIAIDVICHGYAPSELLRVPREGEAMQFTRFEREKMYRNRHAVIGRFIEACCDLRRHYGFNY